MAETTILFVKLKRIDAHIKSMRRCMSFSVVLGTYTNIVCNLCRHTSSDHLVRHALSPVFHFGCQTGIAPIKDINYR